MPHKRHEPAEKPKKKCENCGSVCDDQYEDHCDSCLTERREQEEEEQKKKQAHIREHPANEERPHCPKCMNILKKEEEYYTCPICPWTNKPKDPQHYYGNGYSVGGENYYPHPYWGDSRGQLIFRVLLHIFAFTGLIYSIFEDKPSSIALMFIAIFVGIFGLIVNLEDRPLRGAWYFIVGFYGLMGLFALLSLLL